MGGKKDKSGAVERNKKQKTFNAVWKPVSTQTSINEEILVKDVSEDGSQIQEAHCSISSNVSDAELLKEASEAVDEGPDLNLSSSAMEDNIKDRTLEGGPVPSGEKHSLSVEVGASVVRFIKGKEGSTQRKIEKETGVKIILPSSKKEDSIIIEGMSYDSVTRASEKIQAIIDEAVQSRSLDYSHFVSLPLAIHPELVDKLFNFQNTILGITDARPDENMDSDSNEDTSDNENSEQQIDKEPNVAVKLEVGNNDEHVKVDLTSIPLVSYAPKASRASTSPASGIDKSIFIKPKTFHLTVVMLKLWNKDRVNAATEVLKSISSRVMDALDNRPVFVRLKGVDCLKGSLAKACVLYTPVEEIGNGDRLLHAAQVITDAFYEAGLVFESDYNKKLKLHATLMNIRHRKRHKGKKRVDYFDARPIFKQFGSEEWGEYLIREAHLSQRFVFDDSGYYHCCASIPFPENMQVD
ncbi:Activating signal cointegrator 1 complex subunit 1 [Melia azedarach]|uniref:Activating signal cointegrator 1 complex subunit 1 n=2 Tax=Melia azedarach TaxID=155640 RepID=A0ACC1Y3X1_MELAZ|nr:Activating signal cointegrator 1 complex subunit 1 [Melia azedarach]KAJ4718081.1 Activating signal cointegrator 1 complex subunit 1 [Melia azedarach]